MKKIFTPAKPKRILIVDDDEVVAGIYQNKFERERFEVGVAGSGECALQMLAEERFDLVLLDFSLPGMNGVQVFNAIRSQAGAETLPVIVFSNAYLPGLARAASEAGATRYVRKSDCTPNQMVEIMREVFAARRALSAALSGPPGSGSVVNLSGANSGKTLSAEFEVEYQAKLLASFLADAPQRIAGMRAGHAVFANTKKKNVLLTELFQMHRQARLLAGAAGVCGFRKIAQLASALEALLLLLHGRAEHITPSVIRTIAQAVDLLASLIENTTTPEPDESVSPAILVVDDEIISRETICSALEKAGLHAVSLEDPLAAADLLKQSRFDLIFLDVEMPGQNGLDLCANIRKMAINRATPVVFVTAHSDFAIKARSSLSGGNDFIAKPFLSAELAVKALSWLSKKKPEPVETTNPFSVGTRQSPGNFGDAEEQIEHQSEPGHAILTR